MATAELRVRQDIIDLIEVRTAWNEKEMVKAIPGSRWDPNEKVWTLPLTWAACVQLKGQFGDQLTVGPLLTQWIWDEYNERVQPSMTTRDLHNDPDGAIHNVPNLYTFQQWGVEFIIRAGSGLLGDEMGSGKTIQVLAAMNLIGEETLPALVVCPNSVKPHWAKEIKKWFPSANSYVVSGTAKQRTDTLTKALTDSKAIVITNYEALPRLTRLAGFGSIRLQRCTTCDPKYGTPGLKVSSCEVHPKALNAFNFKTVVVDEAHRIKDPKAKQTRAVWALGRGNTVSRRWALTGTPLANDPSDLWSIMHFVAPDEYPTKSKFVDLYALQAWNNFGGLDVVGLNPLRRDEFFKFFDPRFRCMPKAIVLPQLPPKVRQTRIVEMTPKQRKAYKDVERNLITRLDDGGILVAKSNLSAQIRLLQLSSSYCTIETGVDPNDHTQWTVELQEPSPKLDELMDIITDLGDKPLVVAAEQRRLIELATKRIDKAKISYGLITGAVDPSDRQDALDAFQSGQLRVLLFTLKAGGTGLTMTAADTIVFLQRSWSMIDNKQAEDRVHRIGSEIHKSINVIDIVTDDTVEVTQIKRLNDKAERLEEITRVRARLMAMPDQNVHEIDQLVQEEQQILGSYLGEPE